MPVPLDREKIIVALTDGIGAHFGGASRKSFYQQLERLEGNEGFRGRTLEEKQFLVDLLALAAFYQTVIVPLRCSARFVSVLRAAGATHLRVARDKLGPRYANRALFTTSAFHSVLTEAEIPERVLTYATLRQFIHSSLELVKGRK